MTQRKVEGKGQLGLANLNSAGEDQLQEGNTGTNAGVVGTGIQTCQTDANMQGRRPETGERTQPLQQDAQAG